MYTQNPVFVEEKNEKNCNITIELYSLEGIF